MAYWILVVMLNGQRVLFNDLAFKDVKECLRLRSSIEETFKADLGKIEAYCEKI